MLVAVCNLKHRRYSYILFFKTALSVLHSEWKWIYILNLISHDSVALCIGHLEIAAPGLEWPFLVCGGNSEVGETVR